MSQTVLHSAMMETGSTRSPLAREMAIVHVVTTNGASSPNQLG
jgi:hypothetical protein